MTERQQKTYSHLASQRRLPSEYEIATSKLHYYVNRGFEVEVPLAAWYRRYQAETPLSSVDWDAFSDPRQTTYTKYTALHRELESHVDGALRSNAQSGHDLELPAEWLAVLERVLSPARYAFHGLQMLAAYVGQMAPSSRITIAAALSAADELRRVQRFAYRMAELRQSHAEFGDNALGVWLGDEAWQPMRRLIERLLVTYDFAEAFCALYLFAKPLIDELLMVELGELGRTHGDYVLGEICFSLNEDCRWQRDWSAALTAVIIGAGREQRDVLVRIGSRWLPLCEQAVTSLASALGSSGQRAAEQVSERARAFRTGLGVEP